MADNVVITPGTGNTIAADEVVDSTLGTVKVQYVKLMDGALDGTAKAGVGSNGLKVDPQTLPPDAATQTTLAAVLAKLNASIAVTGAFFQATQPVSGTVTAQSPARSVVDIIRYDYSTPVTTGAYTQIKASTSGAIKRLNIFDSSGQTLVLATGGSGSEVDLMYIFPGGNGVELVDIPAATRLSIKAVSATASSGELTMNTFSAA